MQARAGHRAAPWLALLMALLTAEPARAVYRCGNVFQDRPCGNGEVQLTPSGRPVASPLTQAPGPAPASAFAAQCTRRAQDAQRVAQKREAGATRERQLADLPDNSAREEMIQTIVSVYTRTGTAPEIRMAVQAECLAEKQKLTQACPELRSQDEALRAQARTGGATLTATPGYAEQRRKLDRLLQEARC